MDPEDIIREAIAYTELYAKQIDKGTISEKYRAFRNFAPKILAILRDEVY